MPKIGEKAPDFELVNQDGKTVRLSDYRGKKVIVFVFPKANTMGCNAQACGFRDEFETLQAHNAVVLGVSADSPETLKAWKANKHLPYDLLSDPDRRMIDAWGAWGISVFNVIRLPMIQRAYWVIDENGVVIDGKVPVMPGDSVRRALKAINIDVAPAG